MRTREVRAATAMAASGLLMGAGFPFVLRLALGAVRGGAAEWLPWAGGCWLAAAVLVAWARRLRGRSVWTLGLEILWLAASLAGFALARALIAPV